MGELSAAAYLRAVIPTDSSFAGHLTDGQATGLGPLDCLTSALFGAELVSYDSELHACELHTAPGSRGRMTRWRASTASCAYQILDREIIYALRETG